MVPGDAWKKVERLRDVPSVCTSLHFWDDVDYRINEMNKLCGDAYKAHYECLDNHNQQYKDCRPAERGLNACVLKKMVNSSGDMG